MNVLFVAHGANCPAGSFGDVVEERGHSLDAWAIDSGSPPPRPVADYGAVIVLGGAMHPDQEAEHPWLRDEDELIRGLLARRTPLLGVCLGAQLVAKAADARVYELDEPEIGWIDVELAGAAADDPVFAGLPQRFPAFQWHYYGFDVPAGARGLAWSSACPQAFRLGEKAWAVQFHPEVTPAIVTSWAEESPDPPPPTLAAETEAHIDGWMRFGRALCGSLLDTAEGVS
jgi:GMP synthase-like glutamine amidotransferase